MIPRFSVSLINATMMDSKDVIVNNRQYYTMIDNTSQRLGNKWMFLTESLVLFLNCNSCQGDKESSRKSKRYSLDEILNEFNILNISSCFKNKNLVVIIALKKKEEGKNIK